jgi:hypothetical protein
MTLDADGPCFISTHTTVRIARLTSWTTRYPTVVTVVTVWYAASTGDSPSSQ